LNLKGCQLNDLNSKWLFKVKNKNYNLINLSMNNFTQKSYKNIIRFVGNN